MATKALQITPRLWQLRLGLVNGYLLETEDGLALIDCGYPMKVDQLFAAINETGHDSNQIRHLLLTHGHVDHAGGAAEVRRRTGARIYAHPIEADLLTTGVSERPGTKRSLGLLAAFVYLFIKFGEHTYEPVSIDQPLGDGQILSLAGGIEVIHTPGHSAGHVALLIRQENVLVAGDLCANMIGLSYSAINEDIALAQQSILRVAEYDFEWAVFGHGNPLKGQSNQQLKHRF